MINAVSLNGFPIHRIANALKICPCPTTNTSPRTPFALGFPITGL